MEMHQLAVECEFQFLVFGLNIGFLLATHILEQPLFPGNLLVGLSILIGSGQHTKPSNPSLRTDCAQLVIRTDGATVSFNAGKAVSN